MSVNEEDAALALNPLDKMSRERWAQAAAAVLAQLPMPVIHVMAARGEREFLRVARPIMSGHAFHQSDYKYMFAVLKRTSELNRRIDPRLIIDTH